MGRSTKTALKGSVRPAPVSRPSARPRRSDQVDARDERMTTARMRPVSQEFSVSERDHGRLVDATGPQWGTSRAGRLDRASFCRPIQPTHSPVRYGLECLVQLRGRRREGMPVPTARSRGVPSPHSSEVLESRRMRHCQLQCRPVDSVPRHRALFMSPSIRSGPLLA